MESKILYRGTTFEFISIGESGDSQLGRHMLVESYEEGFVFQIVCLSGYNAGSINGYIREDGALNGIHKGTTTDHLMREINRNFLNIQVGTIKIYEDV